MSNIKYRIINGTGSIEKSEETEIKFLFENKINIIDYSINVNEIYSGDKNKTDF